MTQARAWPEAYYEEFDPQKRRLMLEQAAGGDLSEEDGVRRRLWELRYAAGRKNTPPADRYIALWLALDRWRKTGMPPRKAAAAARELGPAAALLRPEGEPAMVEALVHRELVHAVRLYLGTCLQSSYGTVLLGLVRMNDEQLLQKVAREVAEVTVLVPRWAGLAQELAPLAPAAREAFALVFPEGTDALEQAFARCGQDG